MKAQLNDKKSVLMLKVEISENLNEISGSDLNELNHLSKGKSLVIILTSVSDFKCFIYWKLKDMQNFLAISHYKENFVWEDREVYLFIANFLGECLRRGEIGKKGMGHKIGQNSIEFQFLSNFSSKIQIFYEVVFP